MPVGRASVFSMYMVRKGMLTGEADYNRDGRVSVQEGFRLAAEKAPAFTAGQALGPQHPYIAGGDGKELFLDDPFPVAPAAPAAAPAQVCFLIFCRPAYSGLGSGHRRPSTPRRGHTRYDWALPQCGRREFVWGDP